MKTHMLFYELHDILVHEIIINANNNGTSLTLDIDWFDADFSKDDPEGIFPFFVQPAKLIFKGISNIISNINRIDYPGLVISESNFKKIDDISFIVKIKFSSHQSFLKFNAKDNELIKYGIKLRKNNSQELDDEERKRIIQGDV